MAKLLITSFEPFGLSGKFLRHANASQQVADILRPQQADCDFLVLPVSKDADGLLIQFLEANKPNGILSLGENFLMPGAVNVESYAHSLPPTLNFMATGSGERLVSSFVKTLPVNEDDCGIGTYYCNSLYKTALQWSQKNGNPPTVFAHVATIGNRVSQAQKVTVLLDQMRRSLT